MNLIRILPRPRQPRLMCLALIMAATMLTSALGPPAPPARAAEPTARLQLVVNEVTIHDDREGPLSGLGEMELSIRIWHCPDSYPLPCLDSDHIVPLRLVFAEGDFNAG